MVTMKVNLYIDGFNLYYGLLRFSQNKWLDVVAFAKSLLPRPNEHEIMAVKYFTARVNYVAPKLCEGASSRRLSAHALNSPCPLSRPPTSSTTASSSSTKQHSFT